MKPKYLIGITSKRANNMVNWAIYAGATIVLIGLYGKMLSTKWYTPDEFVDGIKKTAESIKNK